MNKHFVLPQTPSFGTIFGQVYCFCPHAHTHVPHLLNEFRIDGKRGFLILTCYVISDISCKCYSHITSRFCRLHSKIQHFACNTLAIKWFGNTQVCNITISAWCCSVDLTKRRRIHEFVQKLLVRKALKPSKRKKNNVIYIAYPRKGLPSPQIYDIQIKSSYNTFYYWEFYILLWLPNLINLTPWGESN